MTDLSCDALVVTNAITLGTTTGGGHGDIVTPDAIDYGIGLNFIAGDGLGIGDGGDMRFTAGNAGSSASKGGDVVLQGGKALAGGDVAGGNVLVTPGQPHGAGTPGYVFIFRLPTADPLVANALWNDAGTLKVSAGP